MDKIVIRGKLPTLNNVLAITKKHYILYSQEKHQWTAICMYFAKESGIVVKDFPVKIKFTWYLKDRRSDFDNIVFAKKYILDGIVAAGVLPDDTLRYVQGFEDVLGGIDKNDPRVEVEFLKI